jgi:SEC-C motif-containing protein
MNELPILCPCGTGLKYSDCCQPYHDKKADAPTAEKLMRSRYSAYAVGMIDHIERTNHPGGRDAFDRESSIAWSKTSKWIGLEVLSTKEGQSTDQSGEVEFNARYEREGKEHVHYEVGLFERIDSVWYYKEAKNNEAQIRRTEPKVGRNDPCTCGSGKKYKKCCG